MEHLPRIAPSLRSVEYTFPWSLILFLQSTPSNNVLSAFQADCESRGVAWCSAEAQRLAVEWFVQHPVVQKYPPRRRLARAVLKAYITAVEEQCAANDALLPTPSEDPVQVELLEEFIRLSVLGDGSEPELCFKTFYNPFVSAPDTPFIPSVPAAPAPPLAGPSMPLSAIPTVANSSPPQAHPVSPGASPHSSLPPEMHMNSAPQSMHSHSEPAHVLSPSSLPPCIVHSDWSEELLPLASVRSHPTSPSRRLPGHHQQPLSLHSSPQTPASDAATNATARVLDQFSAIRVSSEQFSNVGLSLWPAAFVMVQLLTQELEGQTRMLADVLGLPRASSGMCRSESSAPLLTAPNGLHPLTMPASVSPSPLPNRSLCSSDSSRVTKPYSSQLRIVELGAGACLTPVYLHHMEGYKQHVASFLATDYQEDIVDNMRFNMVENGIHLVSDSLAAERGLEGDLTPPLHRVALLDWMNHDNNNNEGLFMKNEADVILAADCIYDADVIPALVDTIHLALTAPGSALHRVDTLQPSSSAKGDGSAATVGTRQRQRCCIVVQTHRQNATMQKFFSAVRTFGEVRSYTLVRQVVGSLRLSEDYSGIDGGCVPLGGWDRETLLLNPDQMVCALMPDVILEDGSMRSVSHRLHNSCTSGEATTAADRSTSYSPPTTPHRTSLDTSGITSAIKGLPTALQSSKSNHSVDSHVSITRSTSSAAALEAVDALLADEMIGPFYTSMAGLIGVHVVTLKPIKVAQ
ncbi:putative Lysine methyltransferase [Leishmania naiffi]|uniref:Lysine methyltransferase n=1 Tax=Leishmania naiffi TaxID=5678 RepID=A0AAW3BIQ1_9TRYP